MEYSKEFIDKTKKLYPNWQKLHELLDKGSPFVGNLLHEAQPSGGLSLAVILNAESLEDLQELARNEVEKLSLYPEWMMLREEYRRNKNAQILQEIEEAHARGERLT